MGTRGRRIRKQTASTVQAKQINQPRTSKQNKDILATPVLAAPITFVVACLPAADAVGWLAVLVVATVLPPGFVSFPSRPLPALLASWWGKKRTSKQQEEILLH